MNIPMAARAVVEVRGGKGAVTRYDTLKGEGVVAGVSIDLTGDKSSRATLNVLDSEFAFTDRHLAEAVLKEVEARFWLGYGDDLGAPLFTGLLVRADSDGVTASFQFHDKSTKLKHKRVPRYHKKVSDYTLIEKLAGEEGMRFILLGADADAVAAAPVYDDHMQAGTSDWEEIRASARRAGLVVWVSGDGETLYARPAGRVSGESVVPLVWGRDVRLLRGSRLTYKLPDNHRGRPRHVEVRGRGPGGRRLSEKSDESARGHGQVEVRRDLHQHSARGARHAAGGKKGRRRDHALEHTVRLLPVYEGKRIELRQTVHLYEAGAFYSGRHVVDRIGYEFRAGELTCDLTLVGDLK